MTEHEQPPADGVLEHHHQVAGPGWEATFAAPAETGQTMTWTSAKKSRPSRSSTSATRSTTRAGPASGAMSGPTNATITGPGLPASRKQASDVRLGLRHSGVHGDRRPGR